MRKAVILAGGMGTRLGPDAELRPKPMVEIGGKPILWHIMKHLSHYGIREFVIAAGYRGDVIKRYFADATNWGGDMTFDSLSPRSFVTRSEERWKVHICDTGQHAGTATRLLAVRKYIEGEIFLLTYGDGLCDVDVHHLVAAHDGPCSRIITGDVAPVVTLTAVRPPSRYGSMLLEGDAVTKFAEKSSEGWINGGFMICGPALLKRIDDIVDAMQIGSDADLSHDILTRLAQLGELRAHRHDGFWLGMDTPRDKRTLEDLWASGKAPWKVDG